jgi:hypothetical protein
MILRTQIISITGITNAACDVGKNVFCKVINEISEYQSICLNFRFQRALECSVVGYRVNLWKKRQFSRFGLELQSEFLENLATDRITRFLLIILRF